jgi:hypothetical protein
MGNDRGDCVGLDDLADFAGFLQNSLKSGTPGADALLGEGLERDR